MSKFTPGPWELWTSNSWRRFISRDHGSVCEPVVLRDGHPDLYFRNGGADGPDARLIASAPELLEALKYAVDNPEFSSERFDALARAAIAKAEGA